MLCYVSHDSIYIGLLSENIMTPVIDRQETHPNVTFKNMIDEEIVNCKEDFRDKQGLGVLALMEGHLSSPVGYRECLSALFCSPNMSFLARLVSDNSGSFGKI